MADAFYRGNWITGEILMTERKTEAPQWELTWRNLDTGEIVTFKSDENGVIHIPAGNYAPTQRFPPLHSPKDLEIGHKILPFIEEHSSQVGVSLAPILLTISPPSM